MRSTRQSTRQGEELVAARLERVAAVVTQQVSRTRWPVRQLGEILVDLVDEVAPQLGRDHRAGGGEADGREHDERDDQGDPQRDPLQDGARRLDELHPRGTRST